jgi:hypothetical protein
MEYAFDAFQSRVSITAIYTRSTSAFHVSRAFSRRMWRVSDLSIRNDGGANAGGLKVLPA